MNGVKNMKPEEQEKMQKLYFEMQLIDQQMRQLNNQIMLLEEKIGEITLAMSSIDEIKRTKEGEEILISIATGIFAKTALQDNKEFIVNVGAGVAVNKSADGAKSLLEEQIVELVNYREQMLKNMQILENRAKEIEQEVTKTQS